MTFQKSTTAVFLIPAAPVAYIKSSLLSLYLWPGDKVEPISSSVGPRHLPAPETPGKAFFLSRNLL